MRRLKLLAVALINMFAASIAWSQDKAVDDPTCQPVAAAYQKTLNSDSYGVTLSRYLSDGTSRTYQRQVLTGNMLWTSGNVIDWRLHSRPSPTAIIEAAPTMTSCDHVYDEQTGPDLRRRYSAKWLFKADSGTADILISGKTGKLISVLLHSAPNASHNYLPFPNVLMTYDFDLIRARKEDGQARPPLLPKTIASDPCAKLEDAWFVTQNTESYGYEITELRPGRPPAIMFALRKVDGRFYSSVLGGRWDTSLFPPDLDQTARRRNFDDCTQISSSGDVLVFDAYWRLSTKKAEFRVSKSTGKIQKITQDFRGKLYGENKTQVRVYDYRPQIAPLQP